MVVSSAYLMMMELSWGGTVIIVQGEELGLKQQPCGDPVLTECYATFQVLLPSSFADRLRQEGQVKGVDNVWDNVVDVCV